MNYSCVFMHKIYVHIQLISTGIGEDEISHIKDKMMFYLGLKLSVRHAAHLFLRNF